MSPGGQHEIGGPSDPQSNDSASSIKAITPNGDLILEYIASSDSMSPVSRKWQVASQLLASNSPYFQALLDPAKFSEGRKFNFEKQAWDEAQDPNVVSQHALPTVTLPAIQPTMICGEDAIELFLRILCLESTEEAEKANFENHLKLKSSSLVARLIDLADSFNSPRIVRDILRRVGYSYGKGKSAPLTKFNAALLSSKEDRIRQIIFISIFLGDIRVTRVMTHTLIVMGSRFWVNGLESPEVEILRWKYLPHGLEEEIYHRRQLVLNTITDIQAHFLRMYGGMEDSENTKTTTNRTLGAAFTTSAPALLHSRQFQCRGGFNNASQCDLFQLGQMIRFFSVRAKTIFLGSTLIDPDFSATSEDEHTLSESKNDQSPGPPSDITAIISYLKKYPDYPIDEAHTGCGVRRRIMPALECVEKFAWDDRGLLGITPETPGFSASDVSQSSNWTPWADLLHRKHSVDIAFARVTAVYYPSAPSKNVGRTMSQEDLARMLFTAAKRDWSAAGAV
ncbi:unnamed protein product [Penicillium salamii]|uniref:BTB domain-containing protein n=1 Tax=Penicillium salamii TaxID=1612424 RepID=A0A9W4JCM2_9EURO|nr:unnamed protein product [Penicillium salamii]